jgi:RimJ/RimL family protein N-acetyltransferase
MTPPLLHIPEQIETERLILRCPRPGDGLLVNEALRESWADLQQWMNWAQGEPPPVEHSEELQVRSRQEYLERTAFHFSLFLKETGQFVGKPSLLRLDWSVPRGEIGYWIRSSLTGRGLMTEAASAISTFAFETLGFVRVEIRCDPENVRSAAIAERLGYVCEGRLRCDSRNPAGELRDTLIYARIREGGSIG